MSGIGGIINLDQSPVNPTNLKKMTEALKKEGGDCQETWLGLSVGLVHTMLWTTEESLQENQPFHDPQHGLCITADGRIDNRKELCSLLEQKEQPSLTDSQLILYAYVKWGKQCPRHLLGDFAFALWDEDKRTLFCARAPMGIKSFYYCRLPKQFIFGSNISSLFCTSQLAKKPAITQLQNFLDTFTIPSHKTFFDRVERLLPGYSLIVRNNKLQFQRYWFPERLNPITTITHEQAHEQLLSLLGQAVECRTRSAFPVGCEISGGIDSSSILSLAVAQTAGKITPFATYYESMVCDESRFIQAVTNKHKVSPVVSHGDQLDFSSQMSLSTYYKLAPDWPGKGAFLDILAECEEARNRGIRVMLTGHGGDHVMAGNDHVLADWCKRFQLQHLYSAWRSKLLNWSNFKSHVLRPLLPQPVVQALFAVSGRKYQHLSPIHFSLSPQPVTFPTFVQEFDWGLLCGPSHLFWLDSNPHTAVGGHYSIEYRHPFFDLRLVEFLLCLPVHFKRQGHRSKILLKEAMEDLLPKNVIQREEKAEFTPTIKLQLRQTGKKQLSTMTMLPELHIIKQEYYLNLVSGFFDNTLDHYRLNELWRLFCLEKWLQVNFEGTK